MGLLSLAIWTPIAFGVLLLAFGSDKHAGAVRWLALIGALTGFALLVAKGLDQLGVAAISRLGDLDKHDAECSADREMKTT